VVDLRIIRIPIPAAEASVAEPVHWNGPEGMRRIAIKEMAAFPRMQPGQLT